MKNTKLSGWLFLLFGIAFLILIPWYHFDNPQWYLPGSASIHGVLTDKLFDSTLFYTIIIFFITQGLLFLFVFMFQHKAERKAQYYFQNHKLEIIWTVVPAIVMTWLLVQGYMAWGEIKKQAPKDAIVIEVMGEQFAWNFRYPGPDRKFGKYEPRFMKAATNPFGINFDDKYSQDDISVKEIVIPVNKSVLFNIATKDVIHSFYLPHFRVKMDAVPGMRTSFWFVPTMTSADKKAEVKNSTLGMKKVNSALYGMISDEAYKDASGNVIIDKGGLIKRAEIINGKPARATDTVLRLLKAGHKEIKAYQDFTYVLACAELCGLGHYKMRAAITVITQEEYDKWISEQTPDSAYL